MKYMGSRFLITVFALFFFQFDGVYSAECVKELSSKTTVLELLACITEMNSEIESLSIKGAVIVVDSPSGCPAGWYSFSHAEGRFIVGIGPERGNADVSRKFYGQKGGKEEVLLTPAEMPTHSHKVPIERGSDDVDGGYPIIRPGSLKSGLLTSGEGNGKPHENMPPYIALYFCKKD